MSSQRAMTSADPRRRAGSGPPTPRADFRDDPVVLLDARGRPSGFASKSLVHGTSTPLHLGFSCYVVGEDGTVLVTRRARDKRMFPGVWTNSCCGHPRPGEPVEDAVRRHLVGELDVTADSLACVLPDFTYRAVAADDLVEHEVCPVYVATIDGTIVPNPLEVEDARWVSWPELIGWAAERPATLSPWAVAQIARMTQRALDPRAIARSSAVEASSIIVTPMRAPDGDGDGDGDGDRDVGPAADPGVDPVERALDEFLDGASHTMVELEPRAGELVAAIRDLVRAGGKRLRPTFVNWGYCAAGRDDVAAVAPAAAAIELLHTFAMLHDDVMDEAFVRRDRPCAHVRFADLRHDIGAAPARRFGESAAVLAGDLALTWAHGLLATAPCGPAAAAAAQRVLGELCNELVIGQYLDVRLSSRSCQDDEAVRIALLKSARYTVARPLELGAVLGCADGSTIARLREYGDAAGMAFQLRDDVLGVFGDDAVTGKSAADDLRNAKASLLLVRALELATPSGRAVLQRHLGDASLTCDAADRCRDVIAASGALASIERLITAHTDVAHRAASTFRPPVAHALHVLATDIADRAA